MKTIIKKYEYKRMRGKHTNSTKLKHIKKRIMFIQLAMKIVEMR